MNKIDIAKSKFKEGYNCAQSVLFAFAGNGIIDSEMALKISSGFGGGIARNGQVCGAFSASVMLLGLVHGNGIKKDPSIKNNVYKSIDEFMEEFKSRHQSINCREILKGCELKTEGGRKMFEDNKFDDEICIKCVESAVELLNKYI